jgi:ATP-dependent Clp protease, protease subunit
MTGNMFYVKFFAPITADSINALMQTVDRKLSQGAKRMVLLISTPGGDVFQGLSAYNFLKGVPLEITTQNFGSLDSIGIVLFCAGIHRSCVPQSRFLLHGVMANFSGPVSMEERQLEERLKGLQLDMGSIARIVANVTLKDPQVVLNDMRNHLTLVGEQAVQYGLVDEIKAELYETGAEVISIQMGAPVASPTGYPPQPPAQPGFPPGFSFKPPQN